VHEWFHSQINGAIRSDLKMLPRGAVD